jgi:SpoVK/Ycf46/Vps4 family AAA+-type ATPase
MAACGCLPAAPFNHNQPATNQKTSTLHPAEFGASLHPVTAASVFGAYLGESEKRLREAFEAAADAAAAGGKLAIVFLDEVDALCPRREGKQQHEARVVAQLLTLLDGAGGAAAAAAAARRRAAAAGVDSTGAGVVSGEERPRPGRVVVVAATNRPSAIDPALRRPGRLDREVAVPVPGPEQRAAILGCGRWWLDMLPLGAFSWV